MSYDASDPRRVKDRIKQLKVEESIKDALIQQIMGSREGRAWVYDFFEAAHLWRTSFTVDALVMAFAEGERNIGLRLLSDVMRAAPDRYLEMVREASELESLERLTKRETENDGLDTTAAG